MWGDSISTAKVLIMVSECEIKSFKNIFWKIVEVVFFNPPPPPKISKCRPVTKFFQKKLEYPDWPPPKIDDLDTSDKDFMLDGHLVKVRSLSVDGLALVGGDGTPLVNRVTDHVDDAAKGLLTNGDGDGEALILNDIAPENILH